MMREAFSCDDILLVPRFSDLESRSECDPSMDIYNLPIMSAPMDTVYSKELDKLLVDNKMIVTVHRYFKNFKEQLKASAEKKSSDYRFFSVGSIPKSQDWIDGLLGSGIKHFLVDMAHGDTEACVRTVRYIKSKIGDEGKIIAGNVATKSGFRRLEEAGAWAIRVGIGSGCLAEDSRILMSDGTYKNIVDVKCGDRVINKNGEPVTVKSVIFSGKKRVKDITNSLFYKSLSITPEHEIWQHDISDEGAFVRDSVRNAGYLKRIKGQEPSWKANVDCETNSLALMPKNIKFETNKFFQHGDLSPSYELGYIFGSFLGDGSSQSGEFYIPSRKKTQKQGRCTWYFSSHEKQVALKLKSCIKKVFNENVKIQEEKNIIVVYLFRKKIADLFLKFGKKENKHLPKKYMCNNISYIRGIYDGLMDSDGHYANDGRYTLYNTSQKIIELFMFANYCLHGYYPNSTMREPTTGGLDMNIDNCHESYVARTIKRPERRHDGVYQFVKMVNHTEVHENYVDTYDIEVDCPTHSFIANNMIVHNSICSTRLNTGFGVPLLTSVEDCASVRDSAYIIADGGMKYPGDIAKAIAFGADFAMMGRMFASTSLGPGDCYDKNKEHVCAYDELEGYWDDDTKCIEYVTYKHYRGMASSEARKGVLKKASVEGVSGLIKYTGSTEDFIENLSLNMKASLSYAGARNWKDFRRNTKKMRISSASLAESHTHVE